MADSAQQQLDDSLDEITKVLVHGGTLDIKVGVDVLSGRPVVTIGKARFNDRGNALKPEHIERFIGNAAVDLALSRIQGVIKAVTQ